MSIKEIIESYGYSEVPDLNKGEDSTAEPVNVLPSPEVRQAFKEYSTEVKKIDEKYSNKEISEQEYNEMRANNLEKTQNNMRTIIKALKEGKN